MYHGRVLPSCYSVCASVSARKSCPSPTYLYGGSFTGLTGVHPCRFWAATRMQQGGHGIRGRGRRLRQRRLSRIGRIRIIGREGQHGATSGVRKREPVTIENRSLGFPPGILQERPPTLPRPLDLLSARGILREFRHSEGSHRLLGIAVKQQQGPR